jgi:hypothetical protein
MIVSSYISIKNQKKNSSHETSEVSLLNYDTDTETEPSETESKSERTKTRRTMVRYRDMDLLSHGQKIRYVYENRECLGMYNNKSRMFVNEKGENFETPSAFARNHLQEMKMNGKMRSERKTFEVNGWTNCECEVNGRWVSLDEYVNNLRKFLFE